MRLIEDLKKIFQEAENKFQDVKNDKELEELRIKYLGRKSYLANFPSLIKNLSLEEKKEVGKLYNDIKKRIEELYKQAKNLIKEEEIKFDFDDPGEEIEQGRKHLISQTFEKVSKIFLEIGFSIVDFNQIVSEKENFDYLNIPVNHPARDLWDTLWVKNIKNEQRYLFRTHTSCFQVPIIKKIGVPLRAIVYGKVFRYEATDRTHDFEFLQLDGISVSEDSNLAHLKYVTRRFFELFFDKEISIRLRPGYFPFVEPGLEIDIGCIFCNQKGCQVCKKSGFIEVAGAGMIHSFVLKSAGIDFKKYQGYAFGFGLDRLIMLKHGINDIRILHSSDLRFIKQF
jgi:phenylalanyl-tRNA synthetase alpha chain